MPKTLTYLFAAIVLPAFILFASGVEIVQHSCDSCGVVSLTSYGISDCCEDDAALCTVEEVEASCCSSEKQESDDESFCADSCCTFDNLLLAIDESITPENARFKVAEPIVPQIYRLQEDDSLFFSETLLFAFDSHAPPGLKSGISFLIYTHQLKIDCLG